MDDMEVHRRRNIEGDCFLIPMDEQMNTDDSKKPLIAASRLRRDKRQKGSLQFSFICLVICVVIFIVFFALYSDTLHPVVDKVAGQFGYHNKTKTYTVVIDAGSTGTRVLAFEFHLGYLDGRLVLDAELFKQAKPGLSSFINEKQKAAEQILQLLGEAHRFVPQDRWGKTPIVLRATAGLRLLGQDQAEELLDIVKVVLQASGFKTDNDVVSIMDGTDEGIFSWFTVNFLTGRLSGSSQKTVAALDLGGGSTQVTYTLQDEQDIAANKDHIYPLSVLKQDMSLFTNSYLNLGLMAARHGVFTHEYRDNDTNILADCVNSIIQNRPWTYGSVDYLISGKENKKSPPSQPAVDFHVCYNKVKKYVIPLATPKPVSLLKHQIAAFSYYYDRAIETGLVDSMSPGGEITVSDFYQKAKEVCALPNTEQPFMCFDLTFISVLLEHGLGLRQSTTIKLFKQIDNHEISWALGCAYSILTRGSSSFSH